MTSGGISIRAARSLSNRNLTWRGLFPNDRGVLRHAGRADALNAVKATGDASFKVAPILSHGAVSVVSVVSVAWCCLCGDLVCYGFVVFGAVRASVGRA